MVPERPVVAVLRHRHELNRVVPQPLDAGQHVLAVGKKKGVKGLFGGSKWGRDVWAKGAVLDFHNPIQRPTLRTCRNFKVCVAFVSSFFQELLQFWAFKRIWYPGRNHRLNHDLAYRITCMSIEMSVTNCKAILSTNHRAQANGIAPL